MYCETGQCSRALWTFIKSLLRVESADLPYRAEIVARMIHFEIFSFSSAERALPSFAQYATAGTRTLAEGKTSRESRLRTSLSTCRTRKIPFLHSLNADRSCFSERFLSFRSADLNLTSWTATAA